MPSSLGEQDFDINATNVGKVRVLSIQAPSDGIYPNLRFQLGVTLEKRRGSADPLPKHAFEVRDLRGEPVFTRALSPVFRTGTRRPQSSFGNEGPTGSWLTEWVSVTRADTCHAGPRCEQLAGRHPQLLSAPNRGTIAGHCARRMFDWRTASPRRQTLLWIAGAIAHIAADATATRARPPYCSVARPRETDSMRVSS